MGYYTTINGEIAIEPPLTWREFKDSPFAGDDLDVKLRVDAETVDTDDGPLMRKTAPALVPTHDGQYKAYHLVEHVQQAIDTFAGHTFTGRLDCEGEENGDLWRVVIRDGRAEKVTPRIVWPDEDATDPSRISRVELLVERARDKGNSTIDTDVLLDALGLEP